ncbi:MAG: hypothetical protein L0Y67_01205 [Gammaproteobacteria bacterium]|nr:hypothetical protein [Gammaproteobacteria bacterium]
MGNSTTVGLDLAKQVFHVVCCGERGKVITKKVLRRGQMLKFFATLHRAPLGMVINGANGVAH